MDITKALVELAPEAKWTLRGDGYSGLEWFSPDIPKPTRAQVEAKIAELKEDYQKKEYQRQRAQEYPSFAEQFDLLYHGGYDAWKAEIDKIKDKYPKPE